MRTLLTIACLVITQGTLSACPNCGGIVGFAVASPPVIRRSVVEYSYQVPTVQLSVATPAPVVEYQVAPTVRYSRVYRSAAPVVVRHVESTVTVRHDSLQTRSQRRHAKRAEEKLRDAARHASKS